MGKIIIAGIGPGSKEDITPAVLEAVREADAIVGYKYYFQFIEPFVKPGCECIDTGMKRERERAEQAFELAKQGKTVVVISSGDAGIYGMAPLIYEMNRGRCPVDGDSVAVSIEVLPGILLPEFFEKIRKISKVRLMASGLITNKTEVLNQK